MLRLTVSLAAILALGARPAEKESAPAFLEGAAQVEGENLRCTITIVAYVPAVKDGKESTEPRITRTDVVASLKEVRGYVVAAATDSTKSLRVIDAAGIQGALKENPRVYVVNGKELDSAQVKDLKEGSIVLMLPK